MEFKVDPAATTIPKNLKRLAEEAPDREAFVFVDKFDQRISLSRKDVWNKSRIFAAILKEHGIEKGDLVCNTLVNSPERLISIYGTIIAGAISMHGQLLLASFDDLLHNLRLSECKAIIVDEGKNDSISLLNRISYKDKKTGEVCYKELPYLKTVIKLKVFSETKEEPSSRWLSSMGGQKKMFEDKEIHPDDVAVVFNTSGTTGFSKLVPHTHRKLFEGTLCVSQVWKIADGDVLYSNRMLGWHGGFPNQYNTFGHKNIISNHAYGVPENMASHMIKIFEREKCHHANLAGIEVDRILEKLENPLPHPFKILAVGGGPVGKLIEKAIGKITKEIFVGYGATESGIISSILFQESSSFDDYCTGYAPEGVEIKILDDSLQSVSKGQQGEIFVRNSFSTDQYLNDPERTKKSFLTGGWFKTGDIGYQDGNGRLFVLGRKINTVMKGSYILYTGWLEAKILKCQGIQSIAIVGVPDPILYEEVCLCIVKTSDGNLTEDAVREFCQNLFLGTEKDEIVPIPKYYLFFDEFPLNASLKVDRVSLKAEACRRLGMKI